MVKKETTIPKVSDTLVKIGRELLESNPTHDTIYMASDGTGFFEQTDASNHAATLKDKTVTPVERVR